MSKKNLQGEKGRIKISRVSADEFLLKPKTGLTKKMALTIAAMVNQMLPEDKPISSRDIFSKAKDYSYVTEQVETGSVITSVARVKRRNWERAEIANVFVDPHFRRQGFGKKVIEQVETKASQRNFRLLDALIFEDNTPSKKLFESTGYKKQFIFYDPDANKAVGVWQKELTKKARMFKKKA